MTTSAAVRVASRARDSSGRRGFTLIELLVTIAIIGILAGLLATAVAKVNGKAQGIVCVNNDRQLVLAWHLYASDNNDRLPYNLGGVTSRGIAPKRDYNWVNNIMDWEVLNPDNTNTTFVTKGSFMQYANRALNIFRCPSDQVLSEIQRQAGWTARVRSCSMNAMVGDAGDNSRYGTNVFNPQYVQFFKLAGIQNPTGIFVFLDEHPDSINDGYFLNKVDDMEWVDLPASYHNGAASFTFADGHAETHRWLYKSTKPPARPDVADLPLSVDFNQRADFEWVIERTSVEQPPALSRTTR